MEAGRRIRVRGRVQGVGYRPFVWRLAQAAGLSGTVRNDGGGVEIEVWGGRAALDGFVAQLGPAAPPLARVAAVETAPLTGPGPGGGFRIVTSAAGRAGAEITPDAATCAACLSEIRDPADRRHGYAFANCTQCGPRLSIVAGLPYDRPLTSMAAFAMCPDCRREYDDPGDRRFHAQPNACPVCGPRLWLEEAGAGLACADPLAEAARRLRDGAILGIKGIGGVHLACDARNAASVAELRRRKRRGAKPLAVMAPDLARAREICAVSEEEAALLSSPAAPIVLLRSRGGGVPGVAPGLGVTGVMLPYAPLHHLLLEAVGGPIVLTSGNESGRPQVTGNAEARRDLAGLADGLLLHDRDILSRLDDTVMQVVLGAPVPLRRGRGLAPGAIGLAEGFAAAAPVLALGAELKSTICLLEGGRAVPSQHIGDLTGAETAAAFRATIDQYRDLFRLDPGIIAVDRHPDYRSGRIGRALAQQSGARLIAVQHHHAHMAACLAENGIAPGAERSLGIVLDGAGLGLDGTIWGGEILTGGYDGVARAAHLAPVALPGGDRAAQEPWRCAVAHLAAALGPDWCEELAGTALARRLADKPVALIGRMIAGGVNAPLTSSAGRLFDAVAASVGIAFDRQDYEGQAAMELEALAARHPGAGGYELEAGPVIGTGALWRGIARDLRAGAAPDVIAARFHAGLIDGVVRTAATVAGETGLERVALSGGAFQNRILLEGVHRGLTARGLEVLVHRRVPANDGGLSLGQAAVAALG